MVKHIVASFYSGVVDPMMALMAKCGRKRVDPHACRNLHSLIWRTGKVLPVTISTVTMRKRISRRKLAAIPTLHPLLKLSATRSKVHYGSAPRLSVGSFKFWVIVSISTMGYTSLHNVVSLGAMPTVPGKPCAPGCSSRCSRPHIQKRT